MEIAEIRQERTKLERAIAILVADFTQKTEVNVSEIAVRPGAQAPDPNKYGGSFITTTAPSIEVELVI